MKKCQILIFAVTTTMLICGSAFCTVLVVDPAGGGDYLNLEAAVVAVGRLALNLKIG